MTSMTLRLALLTLLALPLHARAAEKIDVWLDVDTANAIGEIDDGLSLIQAFHSPELRVRGVSAVFGNAPLDRAHPIALNITRAFGPRGMPVHRGAASAEQLGQPNDAVDAMAKALRDKPMTILALGPVTNVGSLLRLHPDLHDRIEKIVVVAGRRAGQKFLSTPDQPRPFRDFNFELDPDAMQVLLDADVPLVFAPWEVSSHVWLTRADLRRLREAGAGGSGLFIFATSQQWIDGWEHRLNAPGGNPFDTLAVGHLTHPQWIEGMDVTASIVEGPDDQPGREGQTKPYLVVEPADSPRRDMRYLYRPNDRFKPMLMERLAGPADAQAALPAPVRGYDALLAEHVDDAGFVDYRALKADPARLDRYLDYLADVDLDAMTRDERLATLINAYNAFTLRLILDHYPVESIKDIPTAHRWVAKRWNLGGRTVSLDDIEHGIIRKQFDEPRIHFAVVCAAVDCPPLRREAYTAARLDAQLEDQTRYVHNHDRWLRYQPGGGTIHLTSLYKWYGEDFDGHADSLLDYVARYHAPLRQALAGGDEPAIRYLDYDWALNSRP